MCLPAADYKVFFRYVKELEEAKARVQKAEKEGSPNLDSLKKSLAEIQSKTENIKKEWTEFEKKEKVSTYFLQFISKEEMAKLTARAHLTQSRV